MSAEVVKLSDWKAANHQIDMLEIAAYIWCGEVGVEGMAENVTSPMKLNCSAPQEVRDEFHRRMREQIFSLIHMAFTEGLLRGIDAVMEQAKAEVEAGRNPFPASDKKG